jgi:hypothetical protein
LKEPSRPQNVDFSSGEHAFRDPASASKSSSMSCASMSCASKFSESSAEREARTADQHPDLEFCGSLRRGAGVEFSRQIHPEESNRLCFSFDSSLPLGSAQYQKIIVIDYAWRDLAIRSAWTDRKARAYSDHLPVIADVAFPQSRSASRGSGWMLRSGVALMQQPGQIVTQLGPVAHGGLEQRFLDVARHIAPHRHRGLAEQGCKGLLFGHVAPPRFLRLIEAKVPFP